MRPRALTIAIALLVGVHAMTRLARAASPSIQFGAEYYSRDFARNTVSARGKAWVTKDGRELHADEIEIDFAKQIATACGNVRVAEGEVEIWAHHAYYNLGGEDATLDNATISMGQAVLTGTSVRRVAKDRYEITDGSFTNCNLERLRGPELADCSYDWRVYGKHLSVTVEAYAHIHDAMLFAKDIPVLYFPYLILPVKTKRQSGFLTPTFGYSGSLGNSFTLPYYQVLGSWHDLTLWPTYFTKTGFKLAAEYRYLYSSRTFGSFQFYAIQRRFSPSRDNPAPDDPSRSRALGLFGEGAIHIDNRIGLWGRAQSRQVIRLVTDPYYTFDYASDVSAQSGLPSLRSTIAVTQPSDRYLLTAETVHHQSLVITEDSGVDRGGVTRLPSLSYSIMTRPLLGDLLSFEFDAFFDNFTRWQPSYDSVPAALNPNAKVHVDPDPNYHDGNYIRTGRRLRLEPRLVASLPVPDGFQLQPVLKAGALAYHFDVPRSELVHRQYAEVEVPASLYLARTFETGISGFEKVSHVVQPRFIYAASLFQQTSGDPSHPFFYRNPSRGLSNPRFDIHDQLVPFEYMRFELINRFRRRVGNGTERFFLLQLSEQYNARVTPQDPRFSKRLGPIELLSEFRMWRFSGQVEAKYQLEETARSDGTTVRENELSTSLEYAAPDGDRLSVGSRFTIRADPNLTDKVLNVSWYKVLPFFFDVDGALEYSMRKGELRGYRLGFLIGARTRRCWTLAIHAGRNDVKQPFVNVLFGLDLGGR